MPLSDGLSEDGLVAGGFVLARRGDHGLKLDFLVTLRERHRLELILVHSVKLLEAQVIDWLQNQVLSGERIVILEFDRLLLLLAEEAERG